VNYTCRAIKPVQTPWTAIEADSAGEAVNKLHFQLHGSIKALTYRLEHETVSFLQFEVKTSDEKVERLNSRIFSSGIRRKGGIKRQELTLQEIATQLEHEGDPQTLVAPGWTGEEDYKWGV
jgi:hypothetical protein